MIGFQRPSSSGFVLPHDFELMVSSPIGKGYVPTCWIWPTCSLRPSICQNLGVFAKTKRLSTKSTVLLLSTFFFRILKMSFFLPPLRIIESCSPLSLFAKNIRLFLVRRKRYVASTILVTFFKTHFQWLPFFSFQPVEVQSLRQGWNLLDPWILASSSSANEPPVSWRGKTWPMMGTWNIYFFEQRHQVCQ